MSRKIVIGAGWKPQPYKPTLVEAPQINKMSGHYTPSTDNPDVTLRNNSQDFLAIQSKGFLT